MCYKSEIHETCGAHDTRTAVEQLVTAALVTGDLKGPDAASWSALRADHEAARDAQSHVGVAVGAKYSGHDEKASWVEGVIPGRFKGHATLEEHSAGSTALAAQRWQ
jgi:hypothetical protein